ncbi:MAG: hypothetical protein H8E35_11025 [Ardenticatenia bacterium]|nr:hypothetical protein [Ardenticatenia bacterium]
MDGDVQRRQPGPWRSGSAPRLAQAFVAGLETCPPTSAPILVHLLTDAARRADDWAVFLFVVVMCWYSLRAAAGLWKNVRLKRYWGDG